MRSIYKFTYHCNPIQVRGFRQLMDFRYNQNDGCFVVYCEVETTSELVTTLDIALIGTGHNLAVYGDYSYFGTVEEEGMCMTYYWHVYYKILD